MSNLNSLCPPPPPPKHTTAGNHVLFRRGTFNIQTDVSLYLIYYKIAALIRKKITMASLAAMTTCKWTIIVDLHLTKIKSDFYHPSRRVSCHLNQAKELLLQFLSVWIQSLQDSRLLICTPNNGMFYAFCDLNGFWLENDVTWLTAKFKLELVM